MPPRGRLSRYRDHGQDTLQWPCGGTNARMVIASPSGWRASSPSAAGYVPPFTWKRSAKSASMLRRDHTFGRVQGVIANGDLLLDSGADFTTPLDGPGADRIPIRPGNEAYEQPPVRFLDLRSQRLQRLAVNGRGPAGQEAGVLNEQTVRSGLAL